MKRLLCFSLIIMMVLSLCSCGILENLPQNNPTESVEPAESIVASVNEKATITLNTYSLNLTVGNTYQLVGTVNPPKTLMWRSSNENTAVVNSQGVITAANAGVANITCYADGAIDAVCTVTVTGTTTPSVAPTPEPAAPSQNYSYDSSFIFPHSSDTYLTESEVAATLASMSGYSPSGQYAQDAINEIYARNGYIFKTDKIAKYYNSQSWYTPDPNFSISRLNKYEQKNVALLKKYL